MLEELNKFAESCNKSILIGLSVEDMHTLNREIAASANDSQTTSTEQSPHIIQLIVLNKEQVENLEQRNLGSTYQYLTKPK